MKPLNRAVALLVSVAHLLAACANGTTTQSPAGETSAPVPKAALDTSKMITGWPPDTPGLRDVVFNVQVTRNPNRILSEDGSGFLIIQSEQTSEIAKLVFFNNKQSIYRMPPHQFKILSIGSSMLCRDATFRISDGQTKRQELDFEINDYNNCEPGFPVCIPVDNTVYIFLKDVTKPNLCRTKEMWEFVEKSKSKTPRQERGQLSTGEKVALGIVGAILLIPVAIIFPPAAETIVNW